MSKRKFTSRRAGLFLCSSNLSRITGKPEGQASFGRLRTSRPYKCNFNV
jgi:hypothetical protein